MALSSEARRRLQYGLGSNSIGNEVADSINSGGNPVAAFVAALSASTDLSLASPASVDLNASFSDTEVESALDAKADQSAVSDMMAIAETRLDNLESKVNAILTALKDASLMASS